MPFQEQFQFNQSSLSPTEDDLLDPIANMTEFQQNTQGRRKSSIKACVQGHSDRGSETGGQDRMGFTVEETFLLQYPRTCSLQGYLAGSYGNQGGQQMPGPQTGPSMTLICCA